MHVKWYKLGFFGNSYLLSNIEIPTQIILWVKLELENVRQGLRKIQSINLKNSYLKKERKIVYQCVNPKFKK